VVRAGGALRPFIGAKGASGHGEGGGGFKEEKSRWRVTASIRHIQDAELGGGIVRGGWIWQRCGRAQATWEEGDDRWDPHLS
jgi:hypothetical protein